MFFFFPSCLHPSSPVPRYDKPKVPLRVQSSFSNSLLFSFFSFFSAVDLHTVPPDRPRTLGSQLSDRQRFTVPPYDFFFLQIVSVFLLRAPLFFPLWCALHANYLWVNPNFSRVKFLESRWTSPAPGYFPYVFLPFSLSIVLDLFPPPVMPGACSPSLSGPIYFLCAFSIRPTVGGPVYWPRPFPLQSSLIATRLLFTSSAVACGQPVFRKSPPVLFLVSTPPASCPQMCFFFFVDHGDPELTSWFGVFRDSGLWLHPKSFPLLACFLFFSHALFHSAVPFPV